MLVVARDWQIDGEDASLARQVPHVDVAAVRSNALTADREPQTQTTPVNSSTLEGLKELLVFSRRKSAAFVLDFDEDAALLPACPKADVALPVGELECILQEV